MMVMHREYEYSILFRSEFAVTRRIEDLSNWLTENGTHRVTWDWDFSDIYNVIRVGITDQNVAVQCKLIFSDIVYVE